MILDWACTIEEGHATLSTPPNIDSFNPANKAPVLHAKRASAQLLPLSPAPAVDVNSLTSVLLMQTLAQSGLLSSAAGTITPVNSSAPAPAPRPGLSSPQTPTQQKDNTPPSPQLIPSPSHLVHYLEYAEAHLGVHDALTHKTSLQLNGIGPDILPDVPDKFLSDHGISAGDAICLKKGSAAWWNGPDAKRKQSNTVTSNAESWASGEQPAKRVAYQKWFHDGGGVRFTGPPMRADDADSPPDQDYDLLYFCDVQNQWLPVPHGFTVDKDADPSQLDSY